MLELPIITTKKFETKSTLKGYHLYQDIWVPKIGEKFSTEREQDNPEDKYAVCVNKNDRIIDHFPLGKSGNFTKTIF